MKRAKAVDNQVFADFWNKSTYIEEVQEHFGYTINTTLSKSRKVKRLHFYDLKSLAWRDKNNDPNIQQRVNARLNKSKQPVATPPQDCDIQYAACVLDLLGQVVLTFNPTGAKLTVVTTKKPVIDEVQRVIPGGKLRVSEGQDFALNSYAVTWQDDWVLVTMLEKVEPYLRVQRADMQILKQWAEQSATLRVSEAELVKRFQKE